MNILVIGDSTENMYLLKKFSKRSKIHIIDFPRKGVDLTTRSEEDTEFFDTLLISKQVEKIRKIKDKYDLCIATPWAGSRIAYLAGLNYIMYFVGNDITTPPFVKGERSSLNYLERQFYRKVLDSAVACLAPFDTYYNELKKYRKDAIRMDRIYVDTDLFNTNVKPADLPKNKFVFLSAQRFGLEKGFDTIWKALRLCKSDFEFLQVQWFIEDTTVEDLEKLGETNKKLVDERPPQVRFIPLIKRGELAGYFMAADAIMGQMRVGIQGGIERDAAFCKKPVVCYTDEAKFSIIDGKRVVPPFLPTSKDPQVLADLIDRIVESKEFREKLAQDEHDYVKELSDPEKVTKDWEDLFERLIKEHPSINRKTSAIDTLMNYIGMKIEKYVYLKKMREKNIKVWGEERYLQLTKS